MKLTAVLRSVCSRLGKMALYLHPVTSSRSCTQLIKGRNNFPFYPLVVASRPAGKHVSTESFPQQVLQQHFAIEPVKLVPRTIRQ